MTEQPLIISTNINTLSRLPRNGKNNATYKNSPLTEENLKLHTGMVPSSRETKAHFVLIYVDLQKQLVALEAQLKKEAEEAQEKFNASLPENTPPVIPEVIHVSLLSNSPQTTSPTIDEEPTSSLSTNGVICSNVPEPSSPKSIEEIPSLLDSVLKNGRKSQRIKNLFKKTAKKITLTIRKSSNSDNDNLTPHLDRDIASLNVELSVPPSPSQSTIRSRNSSSRPKTPLKNIFIPHSSKSHNRTNSADTTHTLSIHPTSPSSSLNNNVPYSSAQNSPLLPPPLTPNTNTHLNFEKRNDLSSNLPFSNNSSPPSPNNEKCENDIRKSSPEHRDSGISLVSPGGKSGHHSREHSISSILRKVGNFHAFQKDNQHQFDGHRKEKNWGPFSSIIIGSKDNEMQLLAFRYPSIHNADIYVDSREFGGVEDQDNSSCSGGAFVSEFDSMSGKQKDKERSVTFDLNDQQPSTSDEEIELNKRKRCSTINKNAQSTVIPIDFSDNIMKEINALNILRATDIK